MTSGRLRGKVMKNLDKKNLLIDYVISCFSSKYFNNNLKSPPSPTNEINDPLCDYVKKKYKIKIYRGSEHNVFDRVYQCSRLGNFDVNIRYISACPNDPDNIKTLSEIAKEKIDYMSTRTMHHSKKWKLESEYPEGLSIEIYKAKLLEKIKKYVNKKNMDYPTWNLYSGPTKFRIKGFKLINLYKKKDFTNLRVTIDTNKDLKFVRKLIKLFRLKPGINNFFKVLSGRKKKKLN